MVVQKKGEAPFRPRARLLLILGEQLITNEVIAIVELVKNAYDADATRAEVILEGVADEETGQIVVEDNGQGMTLDTILNVWLEPATEYRVRQKGRGERTTKFGRLPLGEKGVGRFAAHKLGDTVELITRAEGEKTEARVVVDWRQFEEPKYLDEVHIRWETRSPEHFTGKRHGTRITVRKLRKAWTEQMVKNLATKLQGLNSPLAKGMEFEVQLIAPGFEDVLGRIPDLADLLESAFYQFEGEVDSNGILTYTYRFHLPLSRQFEREVTAKKPRKMDIRNPKHFGPRTPLCGSFKVRFYVWDLDRKIRRALRDIVPDLEAELKFIRPHTGIRVYRDEFRVWPYGEPGDDWLRLDARRVNNPPQHLSNNQIIGFVEVSYDENPTLRDKTDREGLIENEQFRDFVELITGSIIALETERRKDKDQVDEWIDRQQATERIKGDAVEENITQLHRKMEREGDLPKYEEDLKTLRARYQETLENLVDPLIVAAGLGISYTIPVHEITRNVKDLRSSLRTARESTEPREVFEKLDQALTVLEQIDEMVKGAGRIIRKGQPENVRLFSAVKDAVDIMGLRLEREGIAVKTQETEPLQVRGRRNLIVTAILNLIDNSAYWLLLKEEDRQVRITVDRSPAGEPRIVVADNGPGIQDDPALLVKPFFTRKPDGSGLGLYIVNRIMQAHEGGVFFLSGEIEDDSLLGGANVALVFPPEKEVE